MRKCSAATGLQVEPIVVLGDPHKWFGRLKGICEGRGTENGPLERFDGWTVTDEMLCRDCTGDAVMEE